MKDDKITVDGVPVKSKRSAVSVISAVLIALLCVAAAAALVAKNFFNFSFNVFFDGWWTLFIIIPSFLGLFKHGSRIPSIGGLIFGGALLCYEQNLFPAELGFWKAVLFSFIVSVLVTTALSIIRGIFFHGSSVKAESGCTHKGKNSVDSVFGNRRIDYSGIEFTGADFNGVFGEITIDLRNAVIPHDCIIEADAVFGTVIIYASPNARFITAGEQVFGSVENHASTNGEALPVVTVEANSVFGKVEIR